MGSKVCSFVESSSCSSRCLNLTIAKTWRLCIIRLCQIIQLQIIKIFQFPCASVVSSIQPIGQRVVMYLCNLVMHTQWMESAELCINLGPISDSVFDSIHVMALSSSSCFITVAMPTISIHLMGNYWDASCWMKSCNAPNLPWRFFAKDPKTSNPQIQSFLLFHSNCSSKMRNRNQFLLKRGLYL